MLGFLLVMAGLLLSGHTPAWVGEGVRANPGQTGLFLLWMCLCGYLLAFRRP